MRFFKAAIAALAVTGALAQPASALEEHRFNKSQSQDGHSISMQGFWQLHASEDGTADMAFECYANGAPFANAIGFQECYLEGEDGSRYDSYSDDANPGFITVNGN